MCVVDADAAVALGAEGGAMGETDGRRGGAQETGNATAVDCIVKEEEE